MLRGRLAFRALAAFALLALAATAPAQAQQPYPNRPVKIIVPYPPGGSFDVVARIVAQDIQESRGWQHAVENRPGADGQIGIQAAARAEPDGYTLVTMTSITHGSTPAIKANLGYDPVADFAPIALLGEAPLVLLVKPAVPATSLAELVKLMRDKPGLLNYGTGGSFSQHYFATAMLLQRAGLPQTAAVQVTFPGLAPAVLALVAGTTDFMFAATGNATQNMSAGTIRALAITSAIRSSRLPDVPTMAEVGYPGLEIAPWVGLGAPAKTPRPIIDMWAEAANAALKKPAVREKIAAIDYEVRGGSPEDFARFFTADIARYNKLVDDLGIVRK